jgi:hypothetical protein
VGQTLHGTRFGFQIRQDLENGSEWKMVSLGRAFYDFLWAAGSVSLQPGLLRLSHWTKEFHQDSHKQTHASLWIRLVALPQEYWR